jgi:cobyrinic acid a,c-diamide synthase
MPFFLNNTMKRKALLIAGTHSGCGKTTVTLGIMAALRQRHMKVQPFKCGPDFIDPTLHLLITGQVSRNLDLRMCGSDYVKQVVARHAPQDEEENPAISVIEGVMGLFDGGRASAAELAALLQIPVVLVVDARAMAESVAALVKGFESLDPRIHLAGVILNQVGSARHLHLLSEAIQKHCQTSLVGYLPRKPAITLPSRHLGLHLGREVHLNRQALLALMNQHVDINHLLRLAQQAHIPEVSSVPLQPRQGARALRLGVAWDAAFCFYYQDNLDMLTQAGIELVLFSPLHDQTLPENLAGLYLGGGYPELHAAELAANQGLRQEILAFSRAGRPVYAECGGFMYLTEVLVDGSGQGHAMVGVYPVQATMQPQCSALGYRRVEMQCNTILAAQGTVCYGHEFHYSSIDPMPEEVHRCFLLDDQRQEGYLMDKTLASYIHLHWGCTPELAQTFIQSLEGM